MKSPEAEPLTATAAAAERPQSAAKNEQVKLRRSISLFSACGIIVGVVVGSGIFVSPKGVLQEAGSVGLSLIVWLFSGLFAMLGALCYAELGTTIPKSGGEYAYINEAFGPLTSFLYLWTALVILYPTANAIIALTFSNYVLKPFFDEGEIPDVAVRLLAGCAIALLTFINCCSVKWATKTQDIFTLTKVGALVSIIVAGIVWIFLGHTDHLVMPELMRGTRFDFSHISLSFYYGVFCFSGWNSLNFVTEELKQPHKNLPYAIYISIPVVTIIYLLVNVAYFAALSTDEILVSSAVAESFAAKILGRLSAVVPIFVACSCIGGLNGCLFSTSRMFFVGARDGLLPELISMINIRFLTPMPALLCLGGLSLMMLTSSNVLALINYASFAEILICGTTVASLLILRITQPKLRRPIKLNLFIPISFTAMSVFLLVLPFFEKPFEVLICLVIILGGFPFYFVFIAWRNKPKFIYSRWVSFTHWAQKLMFCVPETDHCD